MGGYIGARSGTISATVANVQDVTATDSTPEVTIVNNTHEDTDQGREGKVIFKGQQSGGEESTLAEIEANHHGSADDEKGSLVFRTNDGNDGSSPSEVMRINSLGNVGIGTADIDVSTQAGGSGYKAVQIESDEGGQLNFDHNDAGTGSTLGQINFQRAGEVVAEMEGVTDGATDSGRLVFRTQPDGGALTERMRIDHNGRVGIGVTPSTIGTVYSSLQANQAFLINYSDNTTSLSHNVYFNGTNNVAQTTGTSSQYYQNGGNHVWRNAASVSAGATASLTERMKISSGGSFLMPGIYSNTTSASANVVCQYSSGDVQRSTSSRRYKNSIQDSTVGLAELNTLRPVSFKGNNDGDIVFNGLIAEEVHDAGLTQFVEYDEEDRPDAIRYPHMVSLCIKAIQELNAKVETLETENTAIKARLDALEAE